MNSSISGAPLHRESALLGALLLVAFNLRPALASLGPLLETLRADLSLSRAAAGWLTALPVICMGLCAPLAISLHAWFGLRQAVPWACMLLALAIALRGWPSMVAMWLSAAGIGAAIAVLGPLLGAFIKCRFVSRSARISAWSTTALCLGAALAAVVSNGLMRAVGWPLALAVWCGPALLAAVMWWRWAPQTSVMTGKAATLPWRIGRAWLLMLCFGCNSLVFYALLAWLAPACVELGKSPAQAGGLLGVFTVLQLLGTLLIGVLPVHSSDRRPAMLLSGAAVCAGLLGMWQAPLAAIGLWMALLGAGTAGLFAVQLLLPLDYAAAPEETSAWMAMMSLGGYVIAAAGPVLAGWVRDRSDSYEPVYVWLLLVTGLTLLGSVLLGPVGSRKLQPHAL